ncbi:MAG: hypothetical protein MJZ94_00765 [Bacteroidales bacterium]|nr:hypothetical protein [Bacteroidales bacterium]
MNKRFNKIQLICIALLFFAILLQGFTHWIPMKPLGGFTDQTKLCKLTFQTYIDGQYQDKLTEYAKEKTGFREFFIRNYNQVCYSCFRRINNAHIYEGANNELYMKMYLYERSGRRLREYYPSVEDAKIDAQKNVEATVAFIDTLHQHGKEFLFVFAPSKTSVYPEWIPKQWSDSVSSFSLEEYYIQLFKENNIPHIDFRSWFQTIKDTVPYPLYTRYATHWSEYILPFVADSMLRRIDAETGYKMPSIKWVDENLTTAYSEQDKELETDLNLMFPMKKPALPRPIFTLQDTIGKDKPYLFVIADSYFVQLCLSPFVNAFSDWTYWKYNDIIISPHEEYYWKRVKWVPEAYDMLKQSDIVLAIFTDAMVYEYMFGFIDTAYEMFEKGGLDEEEKIQLMIECIKSKPEWYEKVKEQAVERGLTLEEALRDNAIYTIKNTKKK